MKEILDLIFIYDPLNVAVSIAAVGGPENQVHYADSDTYIPNRKLTPLTLQPSFFVTDPNSIIPNGDKASALASSRWYVGSVSETNRVTVTNASATSETPYALGSNGALVVRKNVPHTDPVLLIFEGEFYDTRRKSNVFGTSLITLGTTSNSETTPAPNLSLSKPAVWRVNPLNGLGQATVEAQLYRLGEAVPDVSTTYKWYVVENNVERLIGDPTDFFYVSGQNTKKLTVDAEYMGVVLLRCKAQHIEDNSVVMAETKFMRRFPKSLNISVVSDKGDRLRTTVSSITIKALAATNKGEIANPGKYFFFKYFKNANTAGSTNIEIGHGESMSITRNELINVSQTSPRVLLDWSAHGEYKGLLDENGDYLTDENGNYLTGF